MKPQLFETETEAVLAAMDSGLTMFCELVDGKPCNWGVAKTEHQYRQMIRTVPIIASQKGQKLHARAAELFRQANRKEKQNGT